MQSLPIICMSSRSPSWVLLKSFNICWTSFPLPLYVVSLLGHAYSSHNQFWNLFLEFLSSTAHCLQRLRYDCASGVVFLHILFFLAHRISIERDFIQPRHECTTLTVRRGWYFFCTCLFSQILASRVTMFPFRPYPFKKKSLGISTIAAFLPTSNINILPLCNSSPTVTGENEYYCWLHRIRSVEILNASDILHNVCMPGQAPGNMVAILRGIEQEIWLTARHHLDFQ